MSELACVYKSTLFAWSGNSRNLGILEILEISSHIQLYIWKGLVSPSVLLHIYSLHLECKLGIDTHGTCVAQFANTIGHKIQTQQVSCVWQFFHCFATSISMKPSLFERYISYRTPATPPLFPLWSFFPLPLLLFSNLMGRAVKSSERLSGILSGFTGRVEHLLWSTGVVAKWVLPRCVAHTVYMYSITSEQIELY